MAAIPRGPGLLALGAGLLTLASASLAATSAARAEVTFEPYVFETHDGERLDAELGRLAVPENRSNSASRSIEIAFVRLPGLGSQQAPPVVYLAGGPGGSGVRAGRGRRFRLFQALRAGGDVILLDQRGTGLSTRIEPEECPIEKSYPLDRPLELTPYLALVEELGRDCARFWADRGVDLAAYDTVESARDLEALRVALGVERIDLLAISYGTHLALAYLRLYPDRVDRAVLAGVEGPDHTVKLPGQFEAQLDHLERLTEESPRQAVGGLLVRLEREPVTLRLWEVEGPDRRTTLVVGRREVAQVFMDLLRDPRSMVGIPHLVRRLEAGDYTDVAETLLGMRTLGGLEAMPEAMDGASGISPPRFARLVEEDAATLLGSGLLRANVSLARALAIPDLGPRFRAPVRSDVPVLFVSGSLDGRTPAANAVEVLAGFSDARHLVVENGGHGDDLLISDPRLEAAIVAFLAGAEPGLARVVLPPPDPAAGRRRAPLSPEDAARYVGEYERRPREIWRVLHRTTVESLDSQGDVVARNAVLQIRWDGDGFPFHPISETEFYVDFPWFLDAVFRFEVDDSGRVTHLVFEDDAGEAVRMEKVH